MVSWLGSITLSQSMASSHAAHKSSSTHTTDTGETIGRI